MRWLFLQGWGRPFDKVLRGKLVKAEIDKAEHNVTSVLELFRRAREQGIRMHNWI